MPLTRTYHKKEIGLLSQTLIPGSSSKGRGEKNSSFGSILDEKVMNAIIVANPGKKQAK
jgi:hypothetical protein